MHLTPSCGAWPLRALTRRNRKNRTFSVRRAAIRLSTLARRACCACRDGCSVFPLCSDDDRPRVSKQNLCKQNHLRTCFKKVKPLFPANLGRRNAPASQGRGDNRCRFATNLSFLKHVLSRQGRSRCHIPSSPRYWPFSFVIRLPLVKRCSWHEGQCGFFRFPNKRVPRLDNRPADNRPLGNELPDNNRWGSRISWQAVRFTAPSDTPDGTTDSSSFRNSMPPPQPLSGSEAAVSPRQ